MITRERLEKIVGAGELWCGDPLMQEMARALLALQSATTELLFWIYPMTGEKDPRGESFVAAANKAYDALDDASGKPHLRPFETFNAGQISAPERTDKGGANG